jgi:hypothetical protein
MMVEIQFDLRATFFLVALFYSFIYSSRSLQTRDLLSGLPNFPERENVYVTQQEGGEEK